MQKVVAKDKLAPIYKECVLSGLKYLTWSHPHNHYPRASSPTGASGGGINTTHRGDGTNDECAKEAVRVHATDTKTHAT